MIFCDVAKVWVPSRVSKNKPCLKATTVKLCQASHIGLGHLKQLRAFVQGQASTGQDASADLVIVKNDVLPLVNLSLDVEAEG